MDADDSSVSRQLIHNLISRDTAVREAAQNQVRSLCADAQWQLLIYAAAQEETLTRNPFARLYDVFARKSVFQPTSIFCTAILWTIIDEAKDPRFICPLLNLLATLNGLDYPRDEDPNDPNKDHKLFQAPGCSRSALRLQLKDAVTVHVKIMSALKRILVNRQAADTLAPILEQRRALLLPLNAPYRDVELTLLVLEFLQEAGDEEAIPAIERLANIKAVTDNMKRVQQAAQECVIHLRLRAERGQQAKSLLRASGPGTSDELLRPAAEQVDLTPPEELLRPRP